MKEQIKIIIKGVLRSSNEKELEKLQLDLQTLQEDPITYLSKCPKEELPFISTILVLGSFDLAKMIEEVEKEKKNKE